MIEQARLDLGWSQAQLAEQASTHLEPGHPLTQTTLSRILRGAVPMRVDVAAALAAALGMTLTALLRLAEGAGPVETQALPVTRDSEPPPNGARRRRPRPVTGSHPRA